MFRWTASATTRVGPVAAFAYLADPRHAGAWFARVEARELAPGQPRAGWTWVFYEPAARSIKPVRMTAYEASRRFVWETRLPRPRTNLVWAFTLTPAPDYGTTLTFTLQWRPTPLGVPMALAAVLLSRGALARRTQQTIERARDALEEAYPAAPQSRASEGAGGKGSRRGKR